MSSEAILFKTPGNFIQIKSSGGYYYAERKGMDSVAFVLYDSSKTACYGLVHELKDPLCFRFKKTMFLTTAFGGSNDGIPLEQYIGLSIKERHKHFEDLVIQEVEEESGFTVSSKHISFMGEYFVSTQMNQFCYCYLVNVTPGNGSSQGKARPQDAVEAMSSVKWLTEDQVFEEESKDWKSQVIVAKHMRHLLVSNQKK